MRAGLLVVLASLSFATVASCRKQPRDRPRPSPAPVVPPPTPTSRPPDLTLASEPELPAETLAPDGLTLVYSRSSVTLEGALVHELKDGEPTDPGPASDDIDKMAEALLKAHQHGTKLAALKQQPPSTVATLVVDRGIHYRVVGPALVGLGAVLGYSGRFAVSTPSGTAYLTARLPNMDVDAPSMPPTRVITIHTSNWQIQTPGPTRPALLDGHDRDRLRSALGDTPGPMHVIVDDDIPFQVVADTLTAITRARDGRVVRSAVLVSAF